MLKAYTALTKMLKKKAWARKKYICPYVLATYCVSIWVRWGWGVQHCNEGSDSLWTDRARGANGGRALDEATSPPSQLRGNFYEFSSLKRKFFGGKLFAYLASSRRLDHGNTFRKVFFFSVTRLGPTVETAKDEVDEGVVDAEVGQISKCRHLVHKNVGVTH